MNLSKAVFFGVIVVVVAVGGFFLFKTTSAVSGSGRNPNVGQYTPKAGTKMPDFSKTSKEEAIKMYGGRR